MKKLTHTIDQALLLGLIAPALMLIAISTGLLPAAHAQGAQGPTTEYALLYSSGPIHRFYSPEADLTARNFGELGAQLNQTLGTTCPTHQDTIAEQLLNCLAPHNWQLHQFGMAAMNVTIQTRYILTRTIY